jgi:hypothetical protein
VDISRLKQLLAEERRHLAESGESHFHIVVSTDNVNEWEFPRFTSSPPYRDRPSALQDAKDPRFVAKVGTFDTNTPMPQSLSSEHARALWLGRRSTRAAPLVGWARMGLRIGGGPRGWQTVGR